MCGVYRLLDFFFFFLLFLGGPSWELSLAYLDLPNTQVNGLINTKNGYSPTVHYDCCYYYFTCIQKVQVSKLFTGSELQSSVVSGEG